MSTVTASEVQALRKKTGAGMMDCKKALSESNGDFDKAVEILRKKGQKVAVNRADRDASEGVVLAKVCNDKSRGLILMLNCETDFVAKNDEFVQFAEQVAEFAQEHKINSLDELLVAEVNGNTVQNGVMELVGKIGEKIELSQYDIIEAEQVSAYIHPGNRLATLVGLSDNSPTGVDKIGKEIAMQAAAMSPVAIDKDGVSQEVIDQEMEIGREQARREGKPEAILDKIAEGKLNKFYKENTLLNQQFVRDNSKTVKQYLGETREGLTVTAFKRYSLG